MIVPLVSTLEGMDDALLEAGYNLGGSASPCSAASSCPTRCRGSSPAASSSSCSPPAAISRRCCSAARTELVHRADLQPVHHPLQLGGRRHLRRAALGLHLARRLGGLAADRPEPRHHRRAGVRPMTSPRRSSPLDLPRLYRDLLPLPRRAAARRRRLRLQRLAVPVAAVAGLHPRLVLLARGAEARPLPRRAPAARVRQLALHRGDRRGPLGGRRHLQRLPVRAPGLPVQAGALHPDGGAAGHPGGDPRHLHPGLRLADRQLRRPRARPGHHLAPARHLARRPRPVLVPHHDHLARHRARGCGSSTFPWRKPR